MSNHNKRGNFGKVNTTIPQESESQSPSPTSSLKPSQPEPSPRKQFRVFIETYEGEVEVEMEGNSVEQVIETLKVHGTVGKNGTVLVWYPYHSIRKVKAVII